MRYDETIPRGKPEKIFIAGPPRSGTTLLKEILNRHPDVWITQETHFMEMIHPLKNKLDPSDSNDQNILVQKTIDQLRINLKHDEKQLPFSTNELSNYIENNPPASYKHLFNSIMEVSRLKRGARIGGEKTPRHLFHLGTLTEWFPNARFLITIRDGRDYLASYKHYHERSQVAKDEKERIASLYHPITTSIKWRNNARAILYWKEHPSVKLIKFEQLVESPENTLKNILSFLHLDYSPTMLNVKNSNTSFNEKEQNGITDKPVGRWHDRLTPREIYWFQRINQSYLQKFDYEPGSEETFITGIPALFSFPFHLVRAFWKNRHRTGNLISFIKKRLNPDR